MSDEKMFLCPVDGEKMVRQQHGVGHYHACLSCRGLWIPRTYLLALKRRAAQQMKRQPAEPLVPVAHSVQLKCPECAGVLLPRIQESVPIDICGQCRAVWLDGDEILHIAKAGTAKDRREAESRRRSESAGDGSVWDNGTPDVSLPGGVLEIVGLAMLSLFD